MKFSMNTESPSDFLRGTLASLAELFGGYKDGNEFLDMFDDLVAGDNAELTKNGALALRDLVNRIEGADAALAAVQVMGNDVTVESVKDTSEVDDGTPGDEPGVEFEDPQPIDLSRMVRTGLPPSMFFLRGGPESIDFGLNGDTHFALHGNGPKDFPLYPTPAPTMTLADLARMLSKSGIRPSDAA